MASGLLGVPSEAFPWLLAVVDVGGLALGIRLLWSRFDEEGRGRDLWIPLALGGTLFAVSVPVGRALTHSPFVASRIGCSLLFCVMGPLLMARGLWHLRGSRDVGDARRGQRGWGAALLVLGLGLDLAYLWANQVEPFALQVRRYEVASPAYVGPPLKIVVLADLQTDHVSAYEEGVFDLVEAERPDLMVMPGDYLQVLSQAAYDREQPRLVALFDRIRHRPPLGIFAVHGDVDWSPDSLKGAPVRMLEDEVVRLPGLPLQIIGLINAFDRRCLPPALAASARDFPGVTIVVAHRPDFAEAMITQGVDGDPGRLLAVAGHTHGGQVVVPFFGPLMTLSRLPRRYAGGFHTLPPRERSGSAADGGGERSASAGGWLVVSRGVGSEREWAPRIRFLCPPELVVITLRPAAPAPAPLTH